jgi:iron-regulated transporter 1
MIDILLVASYALTTWNVRSDEWAITLFLTFLFPASLLPVSLYYIATSLTTILLVPVVGMAVERYSRLPTATALLIIQKFAIAVNCFVLWDMTGKGITNPTSNIGFWIVVVVGSILSLANKGTCIAIEKDWPAAIARQDSPRLTKLNSQMKRVDLIAKLIAPLVISGISEITSIPITMIIVGGFAVLTSFLELPMLYRVYFAVPILASKHPNVDVASSSPETEPVILINDMNVETENQTETGLSGTEVTTDAQQSVSKNGSVLEMMSRPVFATSITISLLYLNVLTFGAVMIAYLLASSYSPLIIAVLRIGAVVFEISATVSFTPLVKKIGLIRLGEWAIWIELIALCVAISHFFVGGSAIVSIVLLFVGVSLSRWGLWTFDLAQSQLVQEKYTISLTSVHAMKSQ